MTICDQASEQVDSNVGRAPMPGMLNLEEVLELVKDGFKEATPPQQEFVLQQQ